MAMMSCDLEVIYSLGLLGVETVLKPSVWTILYVF
jgi:hypothetical protein